MGASRNLGESLGNLERKSGGGGGFGEFRTIFHGKSQQTDITVDEMDSGGLSDGFCAGFNH